MELARRQFLHLVGIAAALPALSRLAWAQGYPTRPVHWIVSFTAGGPNDTVARIIGQYLSEQLGQQFIIENKVGAGGNIGMAAVLSSPPDGYTIGFVAPNNAINATLYDKLPFDFVRDSVPVAGTMLLTNVMVVHPDVPAKTVAEFIAYAKANPGKINMASSGSGTSVHMSGELFKVMTGINMQHVPYRGSAPAMQDLLSNRVQVMFDNLPGSVEHIKAGTLRALGGDGEQAGGRDPGRADDRRNSPGLRGGGVVRHRGAQGHAARDRRHAQHGGERGARRSEAQGAAWRAWRRADADDADSIRKVHRGRKR